MKKKRVEKSIGNNSNIVHNTLNWDAVISFFLTFQQEQILTLVSSYDGSSRAFVKVTGGFQQHNNNNNNNNNNIELLNCIQQIYFPGKKSIDDDDYDNDPITKKHSKNENYVSLNKNSSNINSSSNSKTHTLLRTKEDNMSDKYELLLRQMNIHGSGSMLSKSSHYHYPPPPPPPHHHENKNNNNNRSVMQSLSFKLPPQQVDPDEKVSKPITTTTTTSSSSSSSSSSSYPSLLLSSTLQVPSKSLELLKQAEAFLKGIEEEYDENHFDIHINHYEPNNNNINNINNINNNSSPMPKSIVINLDLVESIWNSDAFEVKDQHDDDDDNNNSNSRLKDKYIGPPPSSSSSLHTEMINGDRDNNNITSMRALQTRVEQLVDALVRM